MSRFDRKLLRPISVFSSISVYFLLTLLNKCCVDGIFLLISLKRLVFLLITSSLGPYSTTLFLV